MALTPESTVRVAFVGQRTYFESAALGHAAHGVVPTFIDYRGGAETAPMLDQLQRFAPDVIVAFRPENLPHGVFAGTAAPVVGFLTDPLPRPDAPADPDLEFHRHLVSTMDRGNLDRVVSNDPASWSTATELAPMWRCLPLPVADRFFRAPQLPAAAPYPVFLGHASLHRERTLLPLKHEYDLRHYAHGLVGDALEAVLTTATIGLNVGNANGYPDHENRLLLHLAAGHLVISEPVATTFGLEPGIDYLLAATPDEFAVRMAAVVAHPGAYDRARIRGHHASQQFRASHVWPRLVRDLFADLHAFGRPAERLQQLA